MITTPTDLAGRLDRILGPAGLLRGADAGPRYTQDLWGGDRQAGPRPSPWLVARPASTGEVAAVLRACHEAGQPVVPQGGMTGLVSGGVPGDGELVLSTERMRSIEAVDRATSTMTVEAGAVLQEVHERAEAEGLIFPLDLGSRGSCTIGGCLSTNAGGNRVLLYGMTRDLVLGLEAVLADGTVVGGLHKLVKNNAGYDLRHLFIGTEGTLGVVTRAVLKLVPRPATQIAAFCGVGSVEAAVTVLRRLQAALPGMVSAYELMWDSAYARVVGLTDQIAIPLTGRHRMYVLVECRGSSPGVDQDRFLAALGACQDLLEDARVEDSLEGVQRLWAVRERIAVEALRMKPLFGFDVSLPVPEMESCVRDIEVELRRVWPGVDLIVFGHLGDGNLHFAVVTGEKTYERKGLVEEIVYRNVGRREGSISAEHGIGFEKRPHLHFCRSDAEAGVMRQLKRALDPRGILSPGRVFEVDSHEHEEEQET
jgi:FAD/FMN-containing dehydrogenase